VVIGAAVNLEECSKQNSGQDAFGRPPTAIFNSTDQLTTIVAKYVPYGKSSLNRIDAIEETMMHDEHV
jgi:hypothetical protein